MAKGKKIGFICYIIEGNEPPKLWDSLTDERKEQIRADWRRRLSETMSEYYTQHPDEFLKL